MSNIKKLMTSAAGGPVLNVEDVFSTYLYTGNGSSQTITNGIDLDGEGGLAWVKSRTGYVDHNLMDTERGLVSEGGGPLTTTSTSAQGNNAQTITSFNSNGFTVGTEGSVSTNNMDFVSWTFRKAPKFFDVVTYTGDGNFNDGNDYSKAIPHNLGVAPHVIIIKRTDSSSDWWVKHKSKHNNLIKLNSSSAQFQDASPTGSNYLPIFKNGPNVSDDTHFYLDSGDHTNGLNNPGAVLSNINNATYVAYLFAHNDGDGGFGADGDQDIIKCGTYTGNGSDNGPEIDLGFEPQWYMFKKTSGYSGWFIYDAMRGFSVDPSGGPYLWAHTESEEQDSNRVQPTSTGIKIHDGNDSWNESGATFIYMAIRRGTKVPESATEVFNVGLHNGNVGLEQFIPSGGTGFPIDLLISVDRGQSNQRNRYFINRLADTWSMTSTNSNAEAFGPSNPIANISGYQDRVRIGPAGEINTSSWPSVDYFFRRAPGFFDVVAYTGNGVSGRTVSHNLGVAPQLIWLKSRDVSRSWTSSIPTSSGISTTQRLILNSSTGATDQAYFPAQPTDTDFTIISDSDINANGEDYIAYLFASLPGISKVGSFSHTYGGTTNVDCGFTSGARFVLWKRTDGARHWEFFDTTRGIVAGNDPYLRLSDNNVETSSDMIDPYSAGFSIGSALGTGEFIFYAIA